MFNVFPLNLASIQNPTEFPQAHGYSSVLIPISMGILMGISIPTTALVNS